MINLYPHQRELNDACRQEMIKGHKSVLIQASTGFGKTICACDQIKTAYEKGKQSVFIVPRKQLIEQMSDTLYRFDIPHGYVASGKPFNPYARVHVASAMTLKNKMDEIKPDVVFVDECHIGGAVLDKIINHYKSIGAWIILLSATPERLDGKGLGMWADSMVCGNSVRWLIDNGFLSDYKMYAPSTPDLSGIKTTGGDYNKGQLSEFMEDNKVIIGDAIKHYRSLSMGRLAVCFCTSIKHSKMTAQSFRDNGIPAAHMDGETPMDERKRLIRLFARRELLVLTNVEIMSTGFDLASASGMDVTVETLIDMRPTQSLALQMQKYGRALRKKDYPAIILDHAGNVQRHGFPCTERDWTLEDRKQGNRASNDSEHVPTRQCESCFFIHPPAPKCPECGYTYPITSREIEQVDGELEELDPKAAVIQRKKEQGQAQDLDRLIALGRKRGMKRPEQWAAYVLSARMRKQRKS